MMKSFLAAAALATVAHAAPAAVFPVSVEAIQGTIKPTFVSRVGRDDPNNALGAPDSAFFSLGFAGLAIFDFGSLIHAADISINEITSVCIVNAGLCDNHSESAALFVASDYMAGSFDIAGFTPIGDLGNAAAQAGDTLFGSGFRFLAVLDTTAKDSKSFDGFDIESISLEIRPIPLPMSMTLLASALLGMSFLSRKRA